MDETLVMVALAPIYGIVMIVVGYSAMFTFQKAKELGDSATEQKITEQLQETPVEGGCKHAN